MLSSMFNLFPAKVWNVLVQKGFILPFSGLTMYSKGGDFGKHASLRKRMGFGLLASGSSSLKIVQSPNGLAIGCNSWMMRFRSNPFWWMIS